MASEFPMTSRDKIYRDQGFDGALQIVGRPGLLIVDFVNGFADPNVLGGGNIREAISRSLPVLQFARANKWPIAHSRIVFADDGSDKNVFTQKIPALLALTEESWSGAIVDELCPYAGELIVRKTAPSAFAGTGLAAWLAARGVQSLMVCGCVTSGCVRASVVDAMSLGLRPFVLKECVGDRAIEPHQASLFDMQQKYAEVLSWQELLARYQGHQNAPARSADEYCVST